MQEYNFLESKYRPGTNLGNYNKDNVVHGVTSRSPFANHFSSSNSSVELTKYAFIIAGTLLKDGFTITQLRKIYNYVKKLQYNLKGNTVHAKVKLQFLLPKIVHSIKKEDSRKILFDILNGCLKNDSFQTESDLLYFIDFFEAILNYFEILYEESKSYSKQLIISEDELNVGEKNGGYKS